eukprot:c8765_g1_i3.p1 GENE.c8765_g1_i3~~c8765_g1_i3.p1  ORF type:complete len:445 (+),score=68.18 c8765_g1_i3:73-1335(+)
MHHQTEYGHIINVVEMVGIEKAPQTRNHSTSSGTDPISHTRYHMRRFSEVYKEMRDEDEDGKSKVESIREAIDVWSDYGAYRSFYLIVFMPESFVVLAYSFGPDSLAKGDFGLVFPFLWCDIVFHVFRAIWCFVLFVRNPDRISDYESTRNKFARRLCDRVLVAIHFLFSITFGSFCVHTMPDKGNSPFNTAIFSIVLTCIMELYFFVDPLLTPAIRDTWLNEKNQPLRVTFEEEELSEKQENVFKDRLLEASLKLQDFKGQNRRSFRAIAFVAIAISEIVMLSINWGDFCTERGVWLQGWTCVDATLNFVSVCVPLPNMSRIVESMYNEKATFNPLAQFRILIAIHVVHAAWSVWGLILLTWFASCISNPIFSTIITSVVVVSVLESLSILKLWLKMERVLTLYYLWSLASRKVASSRE